MSQLRSCFKSAIILAARNLYVGGCQQYGYFLLGKTPIGLIWIEVQKHFRTNPKSLPRDLLMYLVPGKIKNFAVFFRAMRWPISIFALVRLKPYPSAFISPKDIFGTKTSIGVERFEVHFRAIFSHLLWEPVKKLI